MKHQIVYKNKDKYSSFPLLTQMENRILIGYFTADIPDHTGVFRWQIQESFDEGETWKSHKSINAYSFYNWPATSSRERSDRFTYKLDGREFTTGSFGFQRFFNLATSSQKLIKSNSLFVRSSGDRWQTIDRKKYTMPFVDIVVTFPRPLMPRGSWEPTGLMLVPAYAVLPNGKNRALAWRSDDSGKTWYLYNMFPDECSINEMAFLWVGNKILAHLRSDEHPYIMESWSDDGIVWTYPTNIDSGGYSVFGGPPHLLRLKDGRILCTYGYRKMPMGIRAIISNDNGQTWGKPDVLRMDGGWQSSLHKQSFWQKWTIWGNYEDKFGMDLGYPVSIQLSDEFILTAYYITCEDLITGIETTKWRV